MKRIIPFMYISVMTGILTAVTAGWAIDSTRLSTAVAQLPAPNAQAEQKIMSELLAEGADGIAWLCGQLTPPGAGDDTPIRYALHGLAMYANRPGHSETRTLYAAAIGRALQSATDKDVQAFLIRQLELAGRSESVELLSEYLRDERLCAPAARALLTIGSDSVDRALLDALEAVTGRNRITIIQGLAQRQVAAAAAPLTALTHSQDRAVALAAYEALAAMGQRQAADLIGRARAEAQGYEKARLTDALLTLARQLGRQGQSQAAATLCRELLAEDNVANQTACAALSVLVEAIGPKSLQDLAAAVRGDNVYLQCQALTLANKIPGKRATQQWLELLTDSKPPVQARIIAMLKQRQDPAALPALYRQLTDSRDPAVLKAAVHAVAQLGGEQALGRLLDFAAAAEDPAVLKATVRAIMTIEGETTLDRVVLALNAMPAPARAALLEGIAPCRDELVVQTLLQRTRDDDAMVRKTAWQTLERLAPARQLSPMVDALLACRGQAEQKAAIGAVVAAAEAGGQTDTLLSRLNGANADQQALLIQVLGRLGGSKALKAIRQRCERAPEPVKDAAIRALAKWPDAEAIEPLLAIVARSDEKLTFRVLAFRQCLALVGQASLPDQAKADYYARLVEAAPRDQERQQAQAELNKVRPVKKPSAEDLAGLREPPAGFVSLFNGRDLTGWKGLLFRPYDNPIRRAELTPQQLAAEQAKADADMRQHWTAQDGILYFDGKGHSLATVKDYQDFELYVDWKIQDRGDSGIYLRGAPQVQIWDPKQWKVGSGGLYNNQKNPSKPTMIADKPTGQWNTFLIRMEGDRVWVWLNDQLVVDNVQMENYWDRSRPIFDSGQIELQCHGNPVEFRNIFIRELPRRGQWHNLFNGKDLTGWIGDTGGYRVEDGAIVCRGGRNLYTANEYEDFHLKFEFKLTPGANNGLGVRAPLSGDAAYVGMELQILDNSAEKYRNLRPYQYHGSICGVAPAKRGYQKPVGQWNRQEVIARGNHIQVILNGTTIVDTDITEAIEKGTMDGRPHPGLKNRSGHLGFLGHGDVVFFRNIQIMPLQRPQP